FASYTTVPASQKAVPPASEKDGVHIVGDEIELVQPIVENHELLGTVYVRASYKLQQRLVDYLAILTAVLLASFAVAVLVSALLQTAITKPILAVTDVAHQVIDRRDFSLRVARTTEDEFGVLVDAFNAMLAEVG